MTEIGRSLILFGLLLALVGGAILLFGGRVPRLPGDIVIRRGTFTFYFPIVTCLVVSVVLSLALALFRR
ncbi:MAG: DUF2905 domain-containing protein [Candidatus Binatia bacterium]